MPRRMLHQVMTVNDIYAYAEPIMEMLREEYGSYDADALDEVQVDDAFIHRLQARGYEVLPGAQVAGEAPSAPPASAPRRRTTAVSSPASEDSKAARRTPTATSATSEESKPAKRTTAARATGEDSKPATRTRRTSSAASAADDAAETPAPRRTTTRRTTRTPRAGTNGESSAE